MLLVLRRPCSTDAGSSQMVGSGDRLTVVGGGGCRYVRYKVGLHSFLKLFDARL